MVSSSGEQEAQRLERAVQSYIGRVQRIPLEILTRAPAPGEWTVMELTAHSAEIYTYWAKQFADIRTRPGTPFGRTASDPDRARFIEEHKGDSPESLIERMRSGSADAARALRAYGANEWQTVTGIHAARGEMHLDAMSDLFLAGHAEEHLKQLGETLRQVQR
jgi:hypothetical protein